MPRNIEIKAKIDDICKHIKLAEKLTNDKAQILYQEDVFFLCPNGRLKLRKFPNAPAQLIFYQRDDQAGPKLSTYSITEISDTDSLQNTLEQAYGIRSVVKKTRHLFLYGRTRIHLDSVAHLGDFIELEVVLANDESLESGNLQASELMHALQIREENLIDKAYIDLL